MTIQVTAQLRESVLGLPDDDERKEMAGVALALVDTMVGMAVRNEPDTAYMLGEEILKDSDIASAVMAMFSAALGIAEKDLIERAKKAKIRKAVMGQP